MKSHPPARAPRHSSNPSALSRLMYIHERLATGDSVRTADLAEQLGVDERTIKRLFETLRHEHGCEITWEPSSKTYFCEHPSEKLPLLRITADEAIAVALAGHTFSAWGGSPLGKALKSALTKIAGVIGNAVSLPVESVSDYISQPEEDAHDDASKKHFGRLIEAIRHKRAITVKYKKPGEDTAAERLLHPLHLTQLEHEWVLVAHDPAKQAYRNFLLTRMEDVRLSGNLFQPPADFDAKKHLAGSFGRHTGTQLQEVRIHFDAYAAPFIQERRWHPSQSIQAHPDGSLDVTLQVSHLLDVQRWILSWGSHAEALAPVALRASISHELELLKVSYTNFPKEKVETGQPMSLHL